MIDLDHHVHGLVLHVEVRVLEQLRNRGDIHVCAARGEGAERRAAHRLVRVPEFDFERGIEIVGALQEFVHAEVVLVYLQYLDQGRFRDFVVVKPVEQLVDVVVSRAAQRPGGALYDTLVAVGEPLAVVVEGLVVDERGEDVDEDHRVRLVGHRECVDDFGDDFRSDFLDLADEFVRARTRRVLLGDELLDQLIGSEAAEQAHR